MNKFRLIFILIILGGFLSIGFCHPGVGIVMDSKGNVFYTDLHHVWKIDPKGNVTIAVEDVHTHELYLDKRDNLFGEHLWYEGEATDKWGHYVWKLTSEGKLQIVKPKQEGFLENYSFVRDSRRCNVLGGSQTKMSACSENSGR
jgi:hypothetical protein